jgi:type I restriction enzyme, S subunit
MDVLLGALDRFIAKKRDIKQAVMQQLLTGHTRLPGFHGEWRTARLKDFVTADRFAIVDGPFGSQLKVDEYVASGVPVIEMEHLIDSYITERIERCITHKKFDDLKRSAVYPGDIIISKTGSLGKLGIIPQTVERGLITSRLAKITLNPSRADRLFVFQFLLKLRNDGYWEKVSQGGTMQILGIGMLQDAPIPDISPAEQTAIAAVLTDMDTELAALEQRLDKTRALKQGMMQELLTGKTRLVSKEDVAHA